MGLLAEMCCNVKKRRHTLQVCRRFLSKKTAENVPSQKPNSASCDKRVSGGKTAVGNYSTVRREWKHFLIIKKLAAQQRK